jgi:GTPase SAR1 family protein
MISTLASSNIYSEQFKIDPSCHRIPQIVIVGDAGSGKKSLVERLIAYPVPTTRNLPVEFRFRQEIKTSFIVTIEGAEDEHSRHLEGKESAPTSFIELLHEIEPLRLAGAELTIVVSITGLECPDLDILILPGLTNATLKREQIRTRQQLSSLITASAAHKNIFFLTTVPVNTRLNSSIAITLFLKLSNTLQVRKIMINNLT